jgi:hypothetical protein
VLLIKSCDMSSVTTAFRDDETIRQMGEAVCSTYGLGDSASGVYLFFTFFALTLLLLTLVIGAANLWLAGHVPKILLVATAHSVSPWQIAQKVLARKMQNVKRRVAHALRLDRPRLTPRKATDVLKFRSARGRAPSAGVPEKVRPIAVGNLTELSISGVSPYKVTVFPNTKCFVQVELAAFAIRWSHVHFVSLHTVEDFQIAGKKKRKFQRFRKNSVMPPRMLKSASSVTLPRMLKSASSIGRASVGRRSSEAAPPVATSRRSSEATPADDQDLRGDSATGQYRSALHITCCSLSGVPQVIKLRLRAGRESTNWIEGLQTLLRMVPHYASPIHWRWTLSCMAASIERGAKGATGFLHRTELKSLLRRANASTRTSTFAIDAVLKAVDESEARLQLPPWLKADPAAHGHQHEAILNARQVTGLLLRLCTASQVISDLFDCHSVDGRFGLTNWLNFVRVNQLVPSDGNKSEAGALPPSEKEAAAELIRATRSFEHAVKSGGDDLSTEQGFSPLQFALQLLDSHNNVVAPARATQNTEDLGERLTHYWTTCSHNSCTAVALELTLPALPISRRMTSPLTAADIIGDQLTGLSTADACNRSRGRTHDLRNCANPLI